jgi:hypothetical protein
MQVDRGILDSTSLSCGMLGTLHDHDCQLGFFWLKPRGG